MKKNISYLAWFLLMIAILSGCAASNTSKPSPLSTEEKSDLLVKEKLSLQDPSKEYEFQPGDVFEVKFFEYPEFDQRITVRPDGKISLPLVENLPVAGTTPSELDKVITEKYQAKITSPEITIILKQFAGQKIYVGGEVNNPGMIQLTSRMTLLQSIFHAGGFKRSAKLDSVILVRNNDNKPAARRLDIEKILYQGDLDVLLKPSDVVFLPKTFITEAGDFVDQYINHMIPTNVRMNFQYLLNRDDNR